MSRVETNTEETYLLSDREKEEYRGILKDSFDAAAAFDGQEHNALQFYKKVNHIDEFVKARNDGKISPKLEAEFAEQTGHDNQHTVDWFMDDAQERAYGMMSRLGDLEDVLSVLESRGAIIDRSNLAYVLTDQSFPADGAGIEPLEPTTFKRQPRLPILVKELETIGIYTDDLVVRVGTIFTDKTRRLPYLIVEIPRLGKSVAICEQYGETTFVCQDILPAYVWSHQTKKQLKAKDNIQDVSFNNKWPFRICNLLLYGSDEMTPTPGETPPEPGAKVSLQDYLKDQEKGKRILTEEVVVAMAKLYRERHPKNEWPAQGRGKIPPDIIYAVTGDKNWTSETWGAINNAGFHGRRGLTRTLSQILHAHGCHYDLTEDAVVKMAKLYRERHPKKQWPNINLGTIDPEILQLATGNPLWQKETWEVISSAGLRNGRGLKRSLQETLDAHGCNYNLTEDMIVSMAQLYREADEKNLWPTRKSGIVDPSIVYAVTKDEHWQEEEWERIDRSGRKSARGLSGLGVTEILLKYGCHYDLTEEIIVKMAKLYRERHPKKQWPAETFGVVDPEIAKLATGEEVWREESWLNINNAGPAKSRGLTRTLAQTLRAHGCHYELTEDLVVKMAKLYRDRHPQKRLPTEESGFIEQDIVIEATSDPHWQQEKWFNISMAGKSNSRGLKRSLAQTLDAHFPERRKGYISPAGKPPPP